MNHHNSSPLYCAKISPSKIPHDAGPESEGAEELDGPKIELIGWTYRDYHPQMRSTEIAPIRLTAES